MQKEIYTAVAMNSFLYETELTRYNYSLFITRQWVEGMADEKDEPIYIQFLSSGRQVGLIAGLIIKGGKLQGKQLYCYAGPAVENNDVQLYNHCLLALKKFASHNGLSRIFIRPWDQQISNKCTAKGYSSTETFEYVIFKDEHPEQDINCSTRIQKNIKKGFKLNAKINQGNSPELLKQLLNMLDATRSRRTSKFGNAYNPFYLHNLQEESLQRLLDNGFAKIYYVETDGVPHCMEFVVEQDGRIYNVLKGSDEIGYQNGLASYLDFITINQFRRKGMIYYNYGGDVKGKEGSGLSMFKEGMGALRQERHGVHTFYLSFPHKILNPLMKIGQCLPDQPLVKKLKIAVSHCCAGSSV